MGLMRRQAASREKLFAWMRIVLLALSWTVLFSSVAWADDCLRDITRAED